MIPLQVLGMPAVAPIVSKRRVSRATDDSFAGVLALLALHVPLAVLMEYFPLVGTLHALGTTGLGLWWAVTRRPLVRVAYVGAYIAGAEVLWRMTGAHVFWEQGKYATTAIFLLALLRHRRLIGPPMPLLYFGLLLPSTLLTMENMDPMAARNTLSFNLSGPFALMVSALFFSHVKLSTAQVHRLFRMLLAPSVGIASVAALSMVTAADLHFGGKSNLTTSGGFGPNQVSSVLGMGFLLCLLSVLNGRIGWWQRGLMFGTAVVLAAQSALTFSRGGLYDAGAGASLALLCLLRDPRARAKVLVVTALLLIGTQFVLLPRLDAFTGGSLSQRFTDTGMTGRDLIMQADLRIWQENPMFGVGPGQAAYLRQVAVSGHASAAHTEFTRLLSEHGTLGLVALLLLLAMAVRNLQRARGARNKAVVAAMIGWSFLYMFNAAMRLMMPAFALGLTFATVCPEEKHVRDPRRMRELRDGNKDLGPPRR
jgi:O-antigen ligase